jgi:hypothetical protein
MAVVTDPGDIPRSASNSDGIAGGFHQSPDAADGRYEVTRWMRANLPVSAVVARFEFRDYLPRMSDFPQLASLDPLEDLLPARPDVIVASENFPRRFSPTAPEVVWYESLVAGELGYRVAFRHRARVPLAIITSERHFRERDPSFTVLHKVNPEIVVLIRNDYASRQY